MHCGTEIDLGPLLRDLGLLLGAVASILALPPVSIISTSPLPVALQSYVCISLDVKRKRDEDISNNCCHDSDEGGPFPQLGWCISVMRCTLRSANHRRSRRIQLRDSRWTMGAPNEKVFSHMYKYRLYYGVMFAVMILIHDSRADSPVYTLVSVLRVVKGISVLRSANISLLPQYPDF